MTSARRRHNLNVQQQDPDALVRLGGWLFKRRTRCRFPLPSLLLIVPVPSAASARSLLGWRGHRRRRRRARFGCGRSVTSASFPGREATARTARFTGRSAWVRNPLYLGNMLLWIGFTVSARLLWLAAADRCASRCSSTTRSSDGKNGCSNRGSARPTASTCHACRDGFRGSPRGSATGI